MNDQTDMNKKMERCPSCGYDLRVPSVYSFHKWATPSIITLLSLMLIALDIVNNKNSDGLEWAHWATVGIWIFYITTQFLRTNPDYGWLFVPIGGMLFVLFFFFLDRSTGENKGFMQLDWALNVIIPMFTFVIIMPIISRLARKEPAHIDILEQLIDSLEE